MKSKKGKNAPTFIQELNEHSQHRVVKVLPNGTNEASEWVHVSEFVVLGSVVSCASNEHAGHEVGLFRISSVAAQVLA